MSTANAISDLAARQHVDQRLDTIDRALLGLLPRSERLEVVAQIEARIGSLAVNSPGTTSELTLVEPDTFVSAGVSRIAGGREAQASSRSLSRLALAAGVLGILALVLLVMTPVAYYIAMIVGDALDEIAAIALLGTHTVAVAVGGVAAVMLGMAALVQLRRRSRKLVGYGWAITGLCTGPMPMLVGGVVVLITGLQLLSATFVPRNTDSAAYHPSYDAAPSASQLPPPALPAGYADATESPIQEPAKLKEPAATSFDSHPAPLPLKDESPSPVEVPQLPEDPATLPASPEKKPELEPLPESKGAPPYRADDLPEPVAK